MSNGWLRADKYEHIAITAATGPGTMADGYAWKWVNHSTEGPPGSIAGTIALFEAKPGYVPHFTIDPMGTGRRVQHVPWTWSSCALRGGAGGWETNRGRAVQMEICGYAKDSQDWPDDALYVIADVIADCILDGCPINPTNLPDSSSLSGTLATVNAPQRMGWGEWRLADGILAHVFVPNNDHWDVGRLNNRRIGQLVAEILNGQGRDVGPGSGGIPQPPPPSGPQVGFISVGMVGGHVKLIQELLRALGYDVGGVDGIFGPRTEAAVRGFQGDKGLLVDGIVGPQTSAALSQAYAGLNGKPPLPTPSDGHPPWPGRVLVMQEPMVQGEDVRVWQARMAERGWHLDVDGLYGPQCRDVCLAFQQEKGLTVDGDVGPQTWDAAWSAPVT